MIPKELLKKIRHIEIRTRNVVNDLFAGHYHSVFKGQGMEFHEVREYIPGDDIRSIDWNVTARMGHPFIKKFTEERELTVMLLVDISGSHAFGSSAQLKKDLAAEIAAVLAFSAIKNNDRVGLILFSDQVERFIAPEKGPRHVLRVIREILSYEPEHTGTNIEPALEYLNHVTRRKTVTFLISDFIDKGYEKAIAVTARRHDLIGLVIDDEREQSWPACGVVEWEDAETGERFLVDTSDKRTRRALAAARAEQKANRLSLFRSSGIDSIHVSAGKPYDRELMKFFKMRESRMRV